MQSLIQFDRQKALKHKFDRDLVTPVAWMWGITENATPTEIFVDGLANMRLEFPDNSVAFVKWQGAAFNQTDGNGTTHGNVAAGEGSFVARRATTAFALVGAATGTGFVFTPDDTNDRMVCTVTGTAGKRILWKIRLDIVCASLTDFGPNGPSDFAYLDNA